MSVGHVAVIDIGKTNAKLALVDGRDLSELAVLSQPNRVLDGPPYPHFDVDAIWAFLLDGLAAFQAAHGITAISVTTHGAAGALLAANGALAAPILDYEHSGPDEVAGAYDALRPEFAATGSPRLPMGLNLGAQIHWQLSQDPTLLDRVAAIVTYPQYWGHRLTGALACDVSSLGCHTDLWDPYKGQPSSLVADLGIAGKLAPARRSGEVLGPVLAEVGARTGLSADTQVLCGIHDSNASLLPHVLTREPPYSVVSTGTWVIAMTMGGADVTLDPARDTLINVNALGAPVPSARFMGGREYDLALGGNAAPCDDATLVQVAATGPLLMPALVSDSGPFQGRAGHWIGAEPAQGSAPRTAAVGFYLAMMTAECLSLTGHRGSIIVEGPFGANEGFCRMLSAATGAAVVVGGAATGTSQGAAMLWSGANRLTASEAVDRTVEETGGSFLAYAARWRAAVAVRQ